MIVHATEDTFEDIVLGDPRTVLVDFWAPWCAPCRSMDPHLEGLSERYADVLMVVKVDVSECPDLASEFGIMSIPGFVLIEGDAVVFQHIGVVSPETLEQWVYEICKFEE